MRPPPLRGSVGAEGFSGMNQAQNVIALATGTQLDGYRIVDVLGAGGFGITYLGEDVAMGRRVAIKEYLPGELATRARDGRTVTPIDAERAEGFAWGLKRFLEEARTLAKFEHPSIVTVFAFFEANGTAYYVMRYVEGESLDRIVPLGSVLEEKRVKALLFPLLDGLEAVHAAGFLHRDIKPSNIFVRRDGTPILIDFGSARMALSGHTKTLTAVLSPGYAPFEQYHADGAQGPWTDLYALGATLYRCIVGVTPPEAALRVNARARNKPDPLLKVTEAAGRRYDPALLAAIDACLNLNEEDRPQSVNALRAALGQSRAAPRTAAAPGPVVEIPAGQTLLAGASGYADDARAREDEDEGTARRPPEPAPLRPRARRRTPRLGLAAAILVLLGAGGVWAYGEYVVPARRAEDEARRKAEEEARKKAEEEARRKADEERRRVDARQPQDCDRLAAAEFDPTNAGGVRGVDFRKIDVTRALAACEQAVARFPDEDRFKLLLARVQIAGQRYAEALALVRPRVAGGDPVAEVTLALLYELGWGVEKNDAEFIRLLRSAAQRGHARAQASLGRAFARGHGVTKDGTESMRWFRKAAEGNFAPAQYAVGRAHLAGVDAAKDESEAARWFRLAADRGHPAAQYDLGTLYLQGRGVAQSDADAVRRFRQSAEQGFAAAQYNLGYMYIQGRGVTQSDAEAVRWFRLAAEQGNAQAQYALGLAYAEGRGVAADRAEAITWLRRAGAQGHEQARKALEQMGRSR
jgi:TPR repeat protein/serine/threonine protein kinase